MLFSMRDGGCCESGSPLRVREPCAVIEEVMLQALRMLVVGYVLSEEENRQLCKVEMAFQLLRYRGTEPNKPVLEVS